VEPLLIAAALGVVAAFVVSHVERLDLRRARQAMGASAALRRRAAARLERSLSRPRLLTAGLDAERRLLLGELLLTCGEYERAGDHASRVLLREREPKAVARARVVLSRALDGQWRFGEADTEASSGLGLLQHLNALPGALIAERAQAARRAGRFDDAQSILRQALVRTDLPPVDRDGIGLHYLLACAENHRFAQAWDYARGLDEPCLSRPLGVPLAWVRMLLLVRRGDLEGAAASLARVPPGPRRLAGEFLVASARGLNGPALVAVKRARWAERKMKDGAAAVDRLDAGDLLTAAEYLGLMRTGRLEEAANAALEQLEPLQPRGDVDDRLRGAAWRYSAARACLELGRHEEAHDLINEALRIPRLPAIREVQLRVELAAALAGMGSADAPTVLAEAREALLDLVRRGADAAEAHLALGRAALACGDRPAAAEALREALSGGPEPGDRPEALYQLGRVEADLGNIEAADTAWREAAREGAETDDRFCLRAREALGLLAPPADG
jgi:tetratricopeptide (TPR) repeat protein